MTDLNPGIQEYEEDLVDLSSPLRPKRFRLGPGHEVVGPPELAVDAMGKMLGMRKRYERLLQSEEVGEEAIGALYEFFEMVFGKEQTDQQLRGRLGMTMMQRLMTAVVEKYAERPTVPSSADSVGSSDGGTGNGSTGGAPSGTLTLDTSQSPVL